MASFKDKQGREWLVRRITRLDIGRLKQEAGLDVSKAMASWEGMAVEVFDDTGEKAVNALWYLCREQAENLSLTPEDFAGIFDGDVLEEARQALIEEMAFFSPRSTIGMVMKSEPNRRAVWAKVEVKMNKYVQQQIEKLTLDEPATN